MIRRILIAGMFILTVSQMHAKKTDYLPQDSVIFAACMEAALSVKEASEQEQLIFIASYFLETPYVAATLEKSPERLVVNLREMDCTTFVENVLALFNTLRSDTLTFSNYCTYLEKIRYRSGKQGNYTSRLHYATDWLRDNECKGFIKDITPGLRGAASLSVNLSYMSTHPNQYAALTEEPAYVEAIRARETFLNQMPLTYIPKKLLCHTSPDVRNGDIVFFTTSISGLDISHLGFVYFVEGELRFIHASQQYKKVVIHPESIGAYSKKIQSQTGVVFARVQL